MNLKQLNLPAELITLLELCPGYKIYNTSDELFDLSLNGSDTYEVKYKLKDGKEITEAIVSKVKNGISVNYADPYMRRRDPDCMFIGDEKPTDKDRFDQRFGYPFENLRKETFDWLKDQHLAVFFFHAGNPLLGLDAVIVSPDNAGFFLYGLSFLQGIINIEKEGAEFKTGAVVYVAPPFRQTHFSGRQVVVHNRTDAYYEMFSYNLYPGPSAKKGVYGMIINAGEEEGWIAPHSSVAQVMSPYDNVTNFMHEGASGGGKSEMLQIMHREDDGRVLLGVNLVTGQKRLLSIPQACQIFPVTDDIAVCHSSIQKNNGKITVIDGETAWFVRVDHITEYGTDHALEKITVHPSEKLMFLNIDAIPGSTALIWEHIYDSPGVKCPNPRVILPRKIVPDVVDKPVSIDVRSFGVRTPPCTRENPTYGIIGIFHLLPPALAWLWRLVSPRGHGNPSIVETDGMGSEGVGSYWPFATGKMVRQANLLLEQFLNCDQTLYTLTPNQHIGAWKCSFVPQWIMREYLTRRGNAHLSKRQYQPAREPLLGYELNTLTIEGVEIFDRFLKVYSQPEVGEEGYDAGAKILREFFNKELKKFDTPELMQTGRQIIKCFHDNGKTADYASIIQGYQ